MYKAIQWFIAQFNQDRQINTKKMIQEVKRMLQFSTHNQKNYGKIEMIYSTSSKPNTFIIQMTEWTIDSFSVEVLFVL